jgi:mRNA interferase YafQ
MLNPINKNRFEKDLRLILKRGKSLEKIKNIMRQLAEQKPLKAKDHDHPLKGEYVDCRECHIEPDWLLIYMIKDDSIIFVRTGSHADLFK